MRIQIAVGLLAIALTTPATAQQNLQTTRAVYVERASQEYPGKSIEPASDLRSGDKVILVVEWEPSRRSGDYLVSSAIPGQLIFQRSSVDADSVSVDGGRNWGKIGNLKIRSHYGERLATVEDVTHLRWRIPPGQNSGRFQRITYSALVR